MIKLGTPKLQKFYQRLPYTLLSVMATAQSQEYFQSFPFRTQAKFQRYDCTKKTLACSSAHFPLSPALSNN